MELVVTNQLFAVVQTILARANGSLVIPVTQLIVRMRDAGDKAEKQDADFANVHHVTSTVPRSVVSSINPLVVGMFSVVDQVTLPTESTASFGETSA